MEYDSWFASKFSAVRWMQPCQSFPIDSFPYHIYMLCQNHGPWQSAVICVLDTLGLGWCMVSSMWGFERFLEQFYEYVSPSNSWEIPTVQYTYEYVSKKIKHSSPTSLNKISAGVPNCLNHSQYPPTLRSPFASLFVKRSNRFTKHHPSSWKTKTRTKRWPNRAVHATALVSTISFPIPSLSSHNPQHA